MIDIMKTFILAFTVPVFTCFINTYITKLLAAARHHAAAMRL